MMLNPNVFQTSSRIQALTTGSSKSIGASCNVFSVEDSIDSICDSRAWTLQVLAHQGAPSIDFSNLRPRGTPVKTGGESSGAVSFMFAMDEDVHNMRRPSKKNGAGIAYLDCFHNDLEDFLNVSFKSLYKAVYIPALNDHAGVARLMSDARLLSLLADAYNKFKCFLVKRPEGGKLTNLCTEVVIKHGDSCILGAINMSALDEHLKDLPIVMQSAAEDMLYNMYKAHVVYKESKLYVAEPEPQFGLGLLGLASWLGKVNMSYNEFNKLLAAGLNGTLDTSIRSLPIHNLIYAYQSTTRFLNGRVNRAFCFQPTVSTALRVHDSEGYNVSPELQPVVGIRTDNGVSTVIKSSVKGDKIVHYHPNTPTIYNTSYEDYRYTSHLMQTLIESTGLAHRHAHCFFGKKFTVEHLRSLYNDPNVNAIKSMYYRLPYQQNTEALKKDILWQDAGDVGDELDLSEFEYTGEDIEPGAACGLDKDSCTVCSM